MSKQNSELFAHENDALTARPQLHSRLCGTEEETVMHYLVALSRRRNSTKEYMTMSLEEFIGNCAKRMDWDLTIQTDLTVAHNRPDIILVEKAIRKWKIIDIAVKHDLNVVREEDWKVEKYQDLAFEVKRIHHVETAILQVVIGALQPRTKIMAKMKIPYFMQFFCLRSPFINVAVTENFTEPTLIIGERGDRLRLEMMSYFYVYILFSDIKK